MTCTHEWASTDVMRTKLPYCISLNAILVSGVSTHIQVPVIKCMVTKVQSTCDAHAWMDQLLLLLLPCPSATSPVSCTGDLCNFSPQQCSWCIMLDVFQPSRCKLCNIGSAKCSSTFHFLPQTSSLTVLHCFLGWTKDKQLQGFGFGNFSFRYGSLWWVSLYFHSSVARGIHKIAKSIP